MMDSDELMRRAQRSEMLTALLRHSAHELRNVAQVLGITSDAISNNPSVDGVYRDAIAQSNGSLLHLLERLERSLLPVGNRPAPFAAADPVETVAALVTRRGPFPHLEVEVDVSRSLKSCTGSEAELGEALFVVLRTMGEMTPTQYRTKVRVSAREQQNNLELTVQSDARAEGAQLLERWSLGVSRARKMLRDWAGELEATASDTGELGVTFRLPYWQRTSAASVAPTFAGR